MENSAVDTSIVKEERISPPLNPGYQVCFGDIWININVLIPFPRISFDKWELNCSKCDNLFQTDNYHDFEELYHKVIVVGWGVWG